VSSERCGTGLAPGEGRSGVALGYVARDPHGAESAETEVTTAITCTNRRPVVNKAIDDSYTLRELRMVDIDAGPSFSDPDGDVLTFSMEGAPASLRIDPTTGSITGLLSIGEASQRPYEVFVKATDPDGEFAELEFTLTVIVFEPEIFRGGFESN
jgi:hypothetical protein